MRLRSLYCVIVLAALAMSGCVSVRDSETFYTPMTIESYTPKAKDAQIPIIGALPNRKFTVIGRISFSSGYGYKFMMECLEWNGRRVGADAVILANSNTTPQQYTYNIPGYTSQEPVTSYGNTTANYYGNNGYSGYGYGNSTTTTYVPVYHEGYNGTGVVYRTAVNAYMIVFQ